MKRRPAVWDHRDGALFLSSSTRLPQTPPGTTRRTPSARTCSYWWVSHRACPYSATSIGKHSSPDRSHCLALKLAWIVHGSKRTNPLPGHVPVHMRHGYFEKWTWRFVGRLGYIKLFCLFTTVTVVYVNFIVCAKWMGFEKYSKFNNKSREQVIITWLHKCDNWEKVV